MKRPPGSGSVEVAEYVRGASEQVNVAVGFERPSLDDVRESFPRNVPAPPGVLTHWQRLP